MKNLVTSALSLLLLTGCATTDWRSYENPDKAITFRMPLAPTETRQVVDTDVGPIEVVMQSSQKDDIYFTASATSYPPGSLEGKDESTLLDGARDGAVTSIQGRLLSETLLQKHGIPGRELWIESSDKSVVLVARIYFYNATLYQVIAATRKENVFRTEISKFLDSIQIKKNENSGL